MYIMGAVFGIVFLAAVILATAQRVIISRRHHHRRQHPQSQTVANGNRPGDNISKSGSGSSSKSGSQSSDIPPNYDSCKKDPVARDPAGLVGKVATPGERVVLKQTSVVDGRRCSLEMMNFLPDADSEAPPSYEEVLREGNPNAIV